MKKKVTAFLLAVAMLLSVMVPMQVHGTSALTVSAGGKMVDGVKLPVNEKVTLSASGAGGYQWQIQVSGDLWVDISGANSSDLKLSYGMIANMLNGETAAIRCRSTDTEEVAYSSPITVTVDYDAVPKFEQAQPLNRTNLVVSQAQAIGNPVVTGGEEEPVETQAPEATTEPAVSLEELTARVEAAKAKAEETAAALQTAQQELDAAKAALDNAAAAYDAALAAAQAPAVQSEETQTPAQPVPETTTQETAQPTVSETQSAAEKAVQPTDVAVVLTSNVETSTPEENPAVAAAKTALDQATAAYNAAKAAFDAAYANDQKAQQEWKDAQAALEAAQNDAPETEDPAPIPAPPVPGSDELETFVIEIQYQFANGTPAASSWTASVAKGSSYQQTVISPDVLGYKPNREQVDLNYTDIQENKTEIVTYQPDLVEFKVKHYQQNLNDDNYTLAETTTEQGYTESAVGNQLKKEYPGFVGLLYDTETKIAADGSTEVEIYYDRLYYLMTFDLDGGYGVEPIYARYGAPIQVGQPEKPGYTFNGWQPEVPPTMPAEDLTIKAQWTLNDKVKVTVVRWGENANDEEYSYIDSAEIYIDDPGRYFTYDPNKNLLCGLGEHTHSAECGYACGKGEHIHGKECYSCDLENHTHSKNCYSGVGQQSSNSPWGAPRNPKEGEVYDGTFYKYIYIKGQWYRYNGNLGDGQIAQPVCGKPEHTHNGNCTVSCGQEEHTHSDACGYLCGETAHHHVEDCYVNGVGMDTSLWTFDHSDTVWVEADGTSVVDAYFKRTEKTLTFHYDYRNRGYQKSESITAKWGADISQQYNAIASNANTTFWSAEYDGSDPYTNYFGVMPQKSADYYHRSDNGSQGSMFYYGEKLDGTGYDEMFRVDNVGGYYVSDEDRYEFEGFTYERGTANRQPCAGAEFYYTRNSYHLTFNDGLHDVKTEDVKFQKPLGEYGSFIPSAPDIYEPNSVEFGGWYLNAECSGEEFVLDGHTMPADNVLLYAKWIPVTHSVKFFKDDTMAEQVGTELTVSHGSMIPQKDVPKVTNGQYQFVGWFYKDNGEEKAFDPENMPVTHDLELYAKWSSNTLVGYTIHYKLRDGETPIAEDTTGSALAGATKTFEAKAGEQLYEAYRQGYFPETNSHSMTMDIDGNNAFTFYYVAKAKVPYTVKYLEKDTNTVLAQEKREETPNAVITENFVPVKGYMPDAYQKRLVLSANEDENVIIFWYTKDDIHAPVQITHYIQNVEGEGYTVYQDTTDLNGVIDDNYSADVRSIDGFTFDHATANDAPVTIQDGKVTAKVTADGLHLELYYNRNEYPYEFRFLEQGTNKQLGTPVTGKARYQAQVTQDALNIPGYTCVSEGSLAINIQKEDSAVKNVQTFYYTEQEVTITYVPIGPDGMDNFGSVNPHENKVKVFTGTNVGSEATAAEGFRFVGWFKDKDCNEPVDESWVNENRVTPAQTKNYGDDLNPKMGYEDMTLYAKFEQDSADLIIHATGAADIDENQAFIFDVTVTPTSGAAPFTFKVAVPNNESKTICNLPAGTYTVTEVGGWSWRYGNVDSQTPELKLVGGRMQATANFDFSNARQNNQWLNGSAIGGSCLR